MGTFQISQTLIANPRRVPFAFSAAERHTSRRLNLQSPTADTKARALYALVFGLFLGLCIWKFGNPVVLDHKIVTPQTGTDLWNDAWPTHWTNWIWPPLIAWGAWRLARRGVPRPPSMWLWLLPLGWLGWQFVAATHTADPSLTAATLWHFGGCVACYFAGAFLFVEPPETAPPKTRTPAPAGRADDGTPPVQLLLLAGILAAFAFCLVRAVIQHRYEYPLNYQFLTEGAREGWTNLPPATVAEMQAEGTIIHTNGVDVANPKILEKLLGGRVCGTLVYPNALAEIILLLWPVSLALAFGATQTLRPAVRWAAIALTVFLGAAAFFWSGSKLAWLIAIGLAGIMLLRLNGSRRLKLAAVAAVVVIGLGVFAVRFHHYFAKGATSASARLDYWRAATQITAAQPLFGSGPGTFGLLYSQIKSPASEMARLAHNDYLEQFCDSGLPGGLFYSAWVILALVVAGRKCWRLDDWFSLAIFWGLLGWFAQGLGEFGLYVPALAWTAFTLLGCLIGQTSRGR